MLLTASGLVVKLAGLFFKLPLTTLIGEEGMGYFSTAYTLFVWFYTLSTSGLPTAEAMMISRAERKTADKRKILIVSLLIFLVLGIFGTLVMAVGADGFSKLLKAEKSSLPILAVSPVLFFICLSAALRGYFQGIGELRPHAFSQIAEAAGKLFLGVALAKWSIDRGDPPEVAAAWAALGLCGGIVAGLIVLMLSFIVTNRQTKNQAGSSGLKIVNIAKNLAKSAIPITLSASAMSLTSILDTLVMTRRLAETGLSQAETIAIYGNYSSLAVPMFNLPPVLVYPIAYALMPVLSSLYKTPVVQNGTKRGSEWSTEARQNASSACAEAARMTMLISLPCVVGMTVLSGNVLSLLFPEELAKRGAMMLTLLAPSSFFVCLLALENTILQAFGREKTALYAVLAGSAVKLVSSWFLIPALGKYGTPISTFLCYFVICLIDAAAIARYTPVNPSSDIFAVKISARPLASSYISVLFAAMICRILPESRVVTIISVTIAAIVYFALQYKDIKNLIGKQNKKKEENNNEQTENRGSEGQRKLQNRRSDRDNVDPA